MQNVVVDSEEAAKAAIRLLKQRDSGRATFLPLSTVRGTVIGRRELAGLPGFVGVASELCSHEAQYAGIRASARPHGCGGKPRPRSRDARHIRYRFRIVSLRAGRQRGRSFTGGSAARNWAFEPRRRDRGIRSEAQKLRMEAEAAASRSEAQQAASRTRRQSWIRRAALTVFNEDKIRFASEIARTERDMEAQKRQYGNLLGGARQRHRAHRRAGKHGRRGRGAGGKR